MPIYKDHKNDFFYRDIEYVDDVQEKTSDLFKDTGNGVNIEFGKVGRYKNTRWAFQKESRFVLNVFPFNPLHVPKEMMDYVGNITANCYKGNKQLPFHYYDMKLQDAVVDNIGYGHGPYDFPQEWTKATELYEPDYCAFHRFVADNIDKAMTKEKADEVTEEYWY